MDLFGWRLIRAKEADEIIHQLQREALKADVSDLRVVLPIEFITVIIRLLDYKMAWWGRK